MKFEVGQEVFIAWNQCHKSQIYEITKVGRKFAHAGHIKINMKTMRTANDTVTVGIVYFSEQAYRDGLRLQNTWREIRNTISNMYSGYRNISIEDMQIIQDILHKEKTDGNA